MNNEMFYNEVKQKVMQHYEGMAAVTLTDVVKNNGLTKTGLCVRKNGSNCGPTIYLNDFYEAYKSGRDLDIIEEEIISLFEEYGVDDNIDIEFVRDFDAVYDKICYRLVDSQRNKCKISDMPHRLIEDLAITYYISIDIRGIEGSIAINNSIIEAWDVTEEDLFEAAMDNTPRLLPAKIESMGSFLAKKGGDASLAELFSEDTFLIAGNVKNTNGATVILYPGLLAEVREKMGCNFFILPSSRHEVILLAEHCVQNGAMNLKDMVECVNNTCVPPEDILSDNVYYYDRKGECIKKVEYVKDVMVL